MTLDLFLKMLMISLGSIGLGACFLGIYSYLRERDRIGLARKRIACAWLVILLGVLSLVVTLVLGIGLLETPEPSAPTADQPTPRPQATATLPPTHTPVPMPTLEPGWTFRERPTDGFAIGLPYTWVELDIDAETMDAALAPIRECCPEMDLTNPLWEEQSIEDLRAAGIGLFAIDSQSSPEALYLGSATVGCQSLDEELTLDTVVQAILEEYDDEDIEPTHRRVELPIGEAERLQLTTGDEDRLLITKYLLVEGTDVCYVTLGCEADLAEEYAAVFEKIAETFRWIEEPTTTPTPEPTPEPLSPSCMPGATFVADVSVPDGTEFAPGESFSKAWRVRSSGCAPWPFGTRLIFDSGDRMGGLPVRVPGASLEGTAKLRVQLTAPDSPGTYKGFWQMQAPDGTRFGERFYVVIVVR